MELFMPEFGLVFWMFVSFAILFFLLAKFAWPFIVKTLEERADLIDKGVLYAQDAKAHLDNAKAEADALIKQAQQQQAEILREAAKMKSQIIEEAKGEASKEAKKLIDAALVSIEQSRKEAESQFRKEVSEFALQIAEKVMRNSLQSGKAQSELVNKLLDEVELKN